MARVKTLEEAASKKRKKGEQELERLSDEIADVREALKQKIGELEESQDELADKMEYIGELKEAFYTLRLEF